jgi:hypothetical protein
VNKTRAQRRKEAEKRRREADRKKQAELSEKPKPIVVSPIAITAENIENKVEQAPNANPQKDKEQRASDSIPKRKTNGMIIVLAGVCTLLFAIALGFALRGGSLTHIFWAWVAVLICGILATAFWIQAYVIEPREATKQAARESNPDQFFISNRAYLSIGNISIAPLVPNQPVKLIVTWANDGNTPVEIRGRTRLVASSSPKAPEWSPNDGDHLPEATIPPHARRDSIMSFEGYSTLEIEAFIQTRRYLLFAAKIVYRTLDTDVQWDVCSLYDAQGKIFVQCMQDTALPKPPSGEPLIEVRKYSITEFKPRKPIPATVELINNGTANALSAVAKIAIYWGPNDPPTDLAVPWSIQNAELLRSQGGAITLTYMIKDPPDDVLAAVRDGRFHFYVLGVFEYIDYRSATILHSKQFCIRFGPTPNDHTLCSTWNSSN